MSSNNKIESFGDLWNHKVYGKIIQLILGYSIVFAIGYFFPTSDAFFKQIIGLMFGVFTIFFVEVQNLRTDNENSNTQIENKIYRKLISTNAIIVNKDNKLAITARVLDDFPDAKIYKTNPPSKYDSESIDLVRILAYQNLLLTPKYLDYFFFRKDSVKKATRIIVLDRDQLNGKVCQATLTYLYLSARYEYETYIITEQKFKQFIIKKCDTEDKRKIIKGNPFMIKTTVKDSETLYDGEYINYQENIENNGLNVDLKGIQNWNLLNELMSFSHKIEAQSSGFGEYIQSCVAIINHKEIA